MEIEVLGVGCPRCSKMYEATVKPVVQTVLLIFPVVLILLLSAYRVGHATEEYAEQTGRDREVWHHDSSGAGR